MKGFEIPAGKRVRVIITTDAKCEADDPFAIAYALMSPKLDVVGITAVHFSKKNWMSVAEDPSRADSVYRSLEEIRTILRKMGLEGSVPVFCGAVGGLADEKTPVPSEAAEFIIREAHRAGPPLYIINIGAVTDLASAFLMDPGIAEGIEAAVWLGGRKLPEGGIESNLENDIAAANVLMDSHINLWLIPNSASASMRVSFAELLVRVQPYGAIGAYLTANTFAVNERVDWSSGESWVLWDMAAVAVVLDPHEHQYYVTNAPHIAPDMRYTAAGRAHPIRVYERIEPRFAMEDFYCKLVLHYGDRTKLR